MKEIPPSENPIETAEEPESRKEGAIDDREIFKRAGDIIYRAEMMFADVDDAALGKSGVIDQLERDIEMFNAMAENPEEDENYPGWRPDDFRLLIKKLESDLENYRVKGHFF